MTIQIISQLDFYPGLKCSIGSEGLKMHKQKLRRNDVISKEIERD